jgi:hypothetical protein
MCVTADGDLVSIFDVMLNHRGLFSGDVHDCQDDLVGVLFGNLLAGLESLDHVFNKLECHLVTQLCAIVSALQDHVVDVKTLCNGRCVVNLDGLQEGVALDDLLAFYHAQLRGRIIRSLLDNELPIPQSIAMLQYQSIGRGTAVVGLDVIGIELNRLVCVRDCEAVSFDFQVGLPNRVSVRSCAAVSLRTWARLV